MRFLTLLAHKIKHHICSNPLQMSIVCVGSLIKWLMEAYI